MSLSYRLRGVFKTGRRLGQHRKTLNGRAQFFSTGPKVVGDVLAAGGSCDERRVVFEGQVSALGLQLLPTMG